MSELNKEVEQTVEVTAETEKVEEIKVEEPFKVFKTKDEFEKEVQSVSSKAKYSILSEIGIKSVIEAKQALSELNSAKSELAKLSELRLELDKMNAEKSKLSEELVLTKYGVQEDVKVEVLTLAKAKLPEFENNLEKAMEATIKKFPQFTKTPEAQLLGKLGTEKAATTKVLDQDPLADFKRVAMAGLKKPEQTPTKK